MRVSEAFPSQYLKAADLQEKQAAVQVERVDFEQIGDDRKPVVYFKGKEKGLVLNKTNANNIAAVYGDETDDWLGADLVLFPTMVDFQGRSVPAIRVKIPPRRPTRTDAPAPMVTSRSAAGPKVQHNELNPPLREDMDDNIPW